MTLTVVEDDDKRFEILVNNDELLSPAHGLHQTFTEGHYNLKPVARVGKLHGLSPSGQTHSSSS